MSYMTYMQTIMEHENIGFDKGFSQANQKIAIGMLKDGMSAEMITKYTDLTLEQVSELAASLHCVH